VSNSQNIRPVTEDTWTAPNPNQVATGAATNPGDNIDLSLGITPNPQLDEVTTAVDTFLWNLYQTLDTPHQRYEQQLRGGIYLAPQNDQGQASNPTATNVGGIAPPFSAASRYAVGDPLADAQMASSAESGLSKAWSTFGQTLQATTNIGQLSQQVSGDMANLRLLQTQLAQVQSGAIVDYQGPSAAALQAKITQLTQQIQTEEAQLGQARNQQAKAGPIPGQVVE